MADWEEIRRLAADFQRAQFADSAQRLSERNCIEIVAKLVLEKKLDVVHTLDGKEYITPPQISREIKDELYTHGGRINIVELQKIINVDLVHIEKQANDVSKQDRGTRLILGQLLDEKYLDQLAEEVNDKLQEVGQVNIAELCKTYDLPGEFLTEELCGRVGRVIDGQVDEFKRGVIFTQAFISRHTARIRGLFSALTRPTPVSTLISLYGFQENLLYSVLEELVNTGRLKGAVVGGRQDKAVYIPEIYSKTQNAWIDSFLKQNGYLEFEALSRLGIPDPVSYIKKRFKSSKLLFLKAACVGPEIIAQLEASVEEAVSSHTWVDLQPVLPSCLSEEDSELLIGQVLRTLGAQSTARILGSAAVSEKFVSDCMALFDDIMRLKAQKEVKNNPVFLIAEEDLRASALLENSTSSKKDKREERRKKSSGVSKQSEVLFLSVEEIMDVLERKVLDCPDDTLEQLAQEILRPLTRKYQEVVRSAFLSSSSSGSGGNRKQNVKDVQEEINNLYNNVRLFEKGTKLFSDDTQLLLMKHLLRTICTDLTNILINLLSADLMMATENPSSITAEVRTKILAKLPEETKAPLMKLNNSLTGKSIEDFVSSLEAAAEECGLLLKKGDKKKERQALLLHKQALLEQLSEAEDPALVLHLTSVLLFQNVTHCVLHAPGRCVPNIISALQPKLPEDQYKLLLQFQGLVVKRLVQSHSQGKKADRAEPRVEPGAEPGGASPDELESVQKELSSLSRSIKELVLNPRRTSTTEE
ncbi:E3 UFM1-protein ligase 1 isoform X2 [Pygocentrus nattereri]|uniref:E3 UFM1-protein ligase 1 isoform X2 n=1 Tax=Pygocentrus nattereri TaxID=42514 RepID=UPI0008147E50|nr:E3 UFM1-protein ligase 1 isoform X2 [Pygocentrus nattereri]